MRKTLALFLFVVLLFPVLLAALSLISASFWIFNRSFYERLADDIRLSDVWLDESLPRHVKRELERAVGHSIPDRPLSIALRTVTTPDYLHQQVRSMIADVLDFLTGRSFSLELYVDVASVKQQLQTEKAVQFAEVLAAELPQCTEQTRAEIGEQRILGCRPVELSAAAASQLILDQLPEFLEYIPDRLLLNRENIYWWPEKLWGFHLPRKFVYMTTVGILLLLSLGLWLSVGYLGGYTSQERLAWFGWTLFVPGIVIFLAGLFMVTNFPFRGCYWQESWLQAFTFTESFQAALLESVDRARKTIGAGFLSSGGISCSLTLGILVWKSIRHGDSH